MRYLLPASFLLLPFVLLSSGTIYKGQQFGMISVGMLVLAWLMKDKWIRAFLAYTAFWMIWLLLVGIFHPDRVDIPMFAMRQNFFIGAWALVVMGARQAPVEVKRWYDLFCIMALVQCGLAISQMLGHGLYSGLLSYIMDIRYGMGATAPVGTIGNTGYLSVYLAICLPFFMRGRWAWGLVPVLFVMGRALSSTAIIAGSVGMIWYWWPGGSASRRGIIVIFALILAMSVYVFGIDGGFGTSLHIRWGYWSQALGAVFSSIPNALFGLGPAARWNPSHSFPLHSEWVTIIHQYGLIGLCMALGFLRSIPRTPRPLFCALIIAAVSGLGNHPLHLAPSAMLIAVIVGLLLKDTEARQVCPENTQSNAMP